MRILFPLLLSCLIAGCNALEPMPGHFTQNLSLVEMNVMLDKHLTPGMALEEAQAFLKKEDFTYVHAKELNPGVQTIRFIRRDQTDFWVEQFWAVTIEASQGKLVRYTVKTESVKQ
jgi:hypothetical protein